MGYTLFQTYFSIFGILLLAMRLLNVLGIKAMKEILPW